MTKRSTKSALLSAILVLCICLTSFVGTTFAWFTDSVRSDGNIIKTGSLDVQLLMSNGENYVDISSNPKPIFGEDSLIVENNKELSLLWEPGATQIVYLAVKNAGTLSLKYNILVDVIDGGLVGALDYAIIDGATQEDAEELAIADWADILAIEGVQTGLVESGRTVAAEYGALESQGYDYFALAVHMKEEAGNIYQDKNVVIDITILSTQLPLEEDSIGDDYDEDAPLDTTKGMVAKIGNRYFGSISEAVKAAKEDDVVEMVAGINTTSAPLTETIIIDKEVVYNPNGVYLVSNAPATFTVVEGGKLIVESGSFTIKNTSSQGASVLVDGGEFVMNGGSFDAYAAVRTTAGKSSTVTLAAGWSNRVTIGFECLGNDTINVTGGSLYTSKESIKTSAGTNVTINMSGGLLSSNAGSSNTRNGAAVMLNGVATVNMTGGTIASTYSYNDLNAYAAIQATVAPTTINISGDAKVTAKGYGVSLGYSDRTPTVLTEKFTLNISGNAEVSATGGSGMAIRYCQDACDVTVSGNGKVSATYHAIAMNFNNYVFTNSSLTVKDNATITSTAGRYGGGYAIAAYGDVTITGGTITGTTLGVGCFGEGATLIIDNSESGTPIVTSSIQVGDGVNYTSGGDWNN